MRIAVLFLILCIGFSCDDGSNSGYNCDNGQCTATFDSPQYLTLADCQSACGSISTAGYNCVNGTCKSVTSNAQYSSLSACQSNCVDTRTGKVSISLGFDFYCMPQVINRGFVGLGYTSSDITNKAYFVSETMSGPGTFTKDNLKAGIYYYTAQKLQQGEYCPGVTKNGSFEIFPAKTTNISVSLF
jgi:hypothetical protein